ncbi:hypothetical protein F0726_00420 [Acidithiobacillus caldus]|nr:hypothetical protein F0726_00420 [Acidithiobacillus caldus]
MNLRPHVGPGLPFGVGPEDKLRKFGVSFHGINGCHQLRNVHTVHWG